MKTVEELKDALDRAAYEAELAQHRMHEARQALADAITEELRVRYGCCPSCGAFIADDIDGPVTRADRCDDCQTAASERAADPDGVFL